MVKTAHFQCTGHRFRLWLGKFCMFLGVIKTNKQTPKKKKERKETVPRLSLEDPAAAVISIYRYQCHPSTPQINSPQRQTPQISPMEIKVSCSRLSESKKGPQQHSHVCWQTCASWKTWRLPIRPPLLQRVKSPNA